MGLLYKLHIMVKCVCYTGLWIHWFRDHGATIPNGSVTIRHTSLLGVDHLRLDSIVLLMLRMVRCVRSFWTASTLLRMGNISGRPCTRVMTYNVLVFSTLKHLGNYHRFYSISFENPKTY
jgi:hypothetical protein